MQATKVGNMVELSLNTAVYFSTPITIKLRGKVEHEDVLVLTNCGATQFHLAVIGGFSQITLNKDSQLGRAVKGKGIRKDVVLNLRTLTIVEKILLLDLVRVYVVLRMQWLRTLGPTRKG